MHNREKYPEIWAAMTRAKEELAPLMEKRKQYTDQIDAIGLKEAELRRQKAELNEKAMEDIDRIRKLRKEISRFAKAMGGQTLSP